MGTHIHVGTANRRNALALLLLALAMLFNTAVPAMAQKNMTGALKKKNLLGKGSFSKAAAVVTSVRTADTSATAQSGTSRHSTARNP